MEGGPIGGQPGDQPDYGNLTGTPVLGFDETIDDYCRAGLKKMKLKPFNDNNGHVGNCQRSGNSILALYGQRFPYNICRNLEWMVCAAKGILPGQADDVIHFAKRPSELEPQSKEKPLGQCKGWRAGDWQCKDDPWDEKKEKAKAAKTGAKLPERRITGYATDSIYFLEVCMYSHICSNGDELFKLKVGDEWRCQFDETAFKGLEHWLSGTEYLPHWKPGDPQDLVIHYKPDPEPSATLVHVAGKHIPLAKRPESRLSPIGV